MAPSAKILAVPGYHALNLCVCFLHHFDILRVQESHENTPVDRQRSKFTVQPQTVQIRSLFDSKRRMNIFDFLCGLSVGDKLHNSSENVIG